MEMERSQEMRSLGQPEGASFPMACAVIVVGVALFPYLVPRVFRRREKTGRPPSSRRRKALGTRLAIPISSVMPELVLLTSNG